MNRLALFLLSFIAVCVPAQAQQRAIVDASEPTDLSVTIYRDPDRDVQEEMNRDNPRGFAMISETRTVTLPAGESTIRFIGVAEGMVGVSAIVTGLPGGTIEKNRNAELLSPAALVNGALGNRVTITRTNPATGEASSEEAIVRTRADGGLVLQSSRGYEAVRCSGIPEKLTFNRIPNGLSAKPIYSVDTNSPEGGTYEVTLTYLAWGFDWQANYVANLGEPITSDEFGLRLLSWLTLVNDNGQSFDNARLQIIAGRLNITSDYEGLAEPPVAAPLRLTCYPFGSTAAGSPISVPPPPPAPVAMMADEAQMIVVTGSRVRREIMESAAPVAVVTAEEEDLGDLKLFRVPARVNVSANGMKQVAFLNKEEVEARYLYRASCDPYLWIEDIDLPINADVLLVTKNEESEGLGIALPQGQMTVFEPTSRGPLLAAVAQLRDYARGQDVELELGQSAQVFARCARIEDDPIEDGSERWTDMRVELTNANPHPVRLRLQLGWAGDWDVRFPRHRVELKNGEKVVEIEISANASREFRWRLRSSNRE
ncbi:MAG: DUF4139 domain-containing protein [Erythrobacter sp.]